MPNSQHHYLAIMVKNEPMQFQENALPQHQKGDQNFVQAHVFLLMPTMSFTNGGKNVHNTAQRTYAFSAYAGLMLSSIGPVAAKNQRYI